MMAQGSPGAATGGGVLLQQLPAVKGVQLPQLFFRTEAEPDGG